MAIEWLKRRAKDLLTYNAVSPLTAVSSEIIYQNIFSSQCRNAGVVNDFYPVGAAANYSCLYLIFRIVTETKPTSIVEFGSGQSTVLIDRIKPDGTVHVCYEEDEMWHALLSKKLSGCDYRLRKLERRADNGIDFSAYQEMAKTNFEFLFVDGPRGTDTFSRYACVDLIEANANDDFVIVFDDYGRTGEQQTVSHVFDLLKRKGKDVKLNSLEGRTRQAVITAGRFRQVSYFY